MYYGSNRSITQTFLEHKNAEDYSGNHLSEVKLTGTARVIKIVNKFKSYADTVNYDDFLKNKTSWKNGEYYNCIGISGNNVNFHYTELLGNSVVLETLENNQKRFITIGHLDSVLVNLNQIVDKNTVIGLQGNTGLVLSGKSRNDKTYGTHIHVEVKDEYGNYLNPRNYGNNVINYDILINKEPDIKEENKKEEKPIKVEFKCDKTDYYYIKLFTGETLQVK